MPNPLVTTARWFAYKSLRTQILSLVACSVIIGVTTIGYLSYTARLKQVEQEAAAWASSLAGMTSRATASMVLERDYGSLEIFVDELVALPGIQKATIVRSGGQVVIESTLTDKGHITAIPADQRITPPLTRSLVEGQIVHAHEPLLGTGRSHDSLLSPEDWLRFGWVDIEFNQSERKRTAIRQWIIDGAVAAVLLTALFWILAIFLRRVFGPIDALTRFAPAMAAQPGVNVRLRWGSHEVRELGHALNATSEQLARQIETQQLRFRRLQAILETAADAIVGVTIDGRISSVNPAAERMLGLDANALGGQPLLQWLPGMDATRLQQIMDEGMLFHSTQSRVGRVEMDALRNDGTRFTVEVLVGEITDDPELRYTCIVRDLTDMKLAEEYLTLYGRVLDCIPNGISVSDARRYPQPMVHVNPAFTRITGYAPHEALGRDASILEGAETNAEDLALLARTVQNGGEIKLTLHNYRKDGSLFHNKLSVSPVLDASGKITHYINVIEDVTAQVEVKERLIERTARLNATFDLSPDGFTVFNAKGELITSNPALRQMVGHLPAWMPLARFDEWMRGLCEDPEQYTPIADAPSDGVKHTLVLARPARRVLERDIRRQLTGSRETFVYFRDITHQFEVDRMKSEFLATAAHELRTPLASILGFTELMLHRKYSEEKQKDLLQTVHRQGSLLQNLIQELLDLSRIEARQGKDFHIVPTALSGIVEAAVSGIANRELGRQVQVGEIPALTVMADASKIEQALVNLLSNAFKYSPHGGEVSVSVREAQREGAAHAVISIRDQGIGMTPEQLSRAFERFYRADASGNIPGTGLGLNLVKEIAEIHGGTVELSSEAGVGTVASLWLRLASTTVDTPETAAA